MIQRRLAALLFGAAWLAAPAHAQTPAATPPMIDGYRAPVGETFLVERAEISPDGSKVAYVAALGNTRRLRVQSLDGTLTRAADLQGADLRDLIWAGDDHILLTIRRDSFDSIEAEDGGVFSVLAYNVARNAYETLLFNRGEMRSSTNQDATRLARQPRMFPIVLDRPEVRTEGGRARVYASTLTLDGSCRNDLYRVEPDTGAARLASQGGTAAVAFVVGADGDLLARQDRDGAIRMSRGPSWRAAASPEAQGVVALLGRGAPDRSVLIRAGEGADARLYYLSGDRGEVAEAVELDGLTNGRPVYDDQTGALLGFRGIEAEGSPAYRFLEPKLGRVWSSVVGAFPAQTVELASWSADFSKLVVFVTGEAGAEYNLIDVAKGESRILAPSYVDAGGMQDGVAALDRTGSYVSIRAEAQAGIVSPRTVCRLSQGRNLTMP